MSAVIMVVVGSRLGHTTLFFPPNKARGPLCGVFRGSLYTAAYIYKLRKFRTHLPLTRQDGYLGKDFQLVTRASRSNSIHLSSTEPKCGIISLSRA